MPLNVLIILKTIKMNNFSFEVDNPETDDLEPGREKNVAEFITQFHAGALKLHKANHKTTF